METFADIISPQYLSFLGLCPVAKNIEFHTPRTLTTLITLIHAVIALPYVLLAGKLVTLMGGKVIAYKLHSNVASATQARLVLLGSFAYLGIE